MVACTLEAEEQSWSWTAPELGLVLVLAPELGSTAAVQAVPVQASTAAVQAVPELELEQAVPASTAEVPGVQELEQAVPAGQLGEMPAGRGLVQVEQVEPRWW
jgi:hypothetical protein